MSEVIQDIGEFNVKDELVFVDEVFCCNYTEEIVVNALHNGSESSGSFSYVCSDSLSLSERTEPSTDSNDEGLEVNLETENMNITLESPNSLNLGKVNLAYTNLDNLMMSERTKPTTKDKNKKYPVEGKEIVMKRDNLESQLNKNKLNTFESVCSTSSDGINCWGPNIVPPTLKGNVISPSEDVQSDMIEVRIESSGRRVWACKECDKKFISRKGSVIHLRTHTGERPFTCGICSKRFIDGSTLMKHQVIHQDTRPFNCTICQRGFNQKVALQRHESTHSLQPLFTCKFCPKTFFVRSSLQAHENIHSRIKPYVCCFCPSRFHTLTLQKQHERVHTNERPFPCNFCPKAFKDSGTLFKHEVIHSGIKPYSCPLCSNGFTQKVAVRKHIKTHLLKSNSTRCSICEINVLNQDELCIHLEKHVLENSNLVNYRSEVLVTESDYVIKNHQTKVNLEESDLSDLATLCDVAISTSTNYFSEEKTDIIRGQFCCVYCGMRYKRERTLHSHLTGVHLFCLLCKTKFYDRKDLVSHICSGRRDIVCKGSSDPNFKSANQQFYCEKCSKSFNSRNGFVIHQRSHTGERPYGCRWCNKAFGDSATRHKHERIHTGERPFKCSTCPRAFNQRAALRAHQVTHTCDRAFTCQHCPSSFLYATALRKHVEDYHVDNLEVSCPLCSKTCFDSDSLHSHITLVHAGDSQECIFCESGVFTNRSEYCDHLVWHAKQHVLDVYVKRQWKTNRGRKDKK